MVIDHVQSLLQASPNPEGFAFFYCSRNGNDQKRRESLSVLQSYVRQLSADIWKPGNMLKSLRDRRREMMKRGSNHLSFEARKELLLESMKLYTKTALVLDALDECEKDSHRELVEVIEDLLSKSERPLKVFISSRPDGDIRELFNSWPKHQKSSHR